MGPGLSVLIASAVVAGAQPEKVVLRLKWWHQFQFAGYYAAQAKGYYADEGLDVRIEEGRKEQSSVEAVLAGEADFGVGDSDIVRFRMKGDPLVVCAAIFQHSPYVMLTLKERGIRQPSDLIGGKVMLSNHQGLAQFLSMLKSEGIALDQVQVLSHSWRLDDLLAGKVDAISAYATWEPLQLKARGVETHLLTSRDYGVDFYGDTLFANGARLAGHEARTEAFVRASLKGWAYALQHPGEIADLILRMNGVRERGITRELLLNEAEAMQPFILPDFIEIGHMNPGRWQSIANVYVSLGMAPAEATLEGFVHAPRDSRPAALPRWLLRGLGAASLVWLLVVLWNVAMRRRVTERTRQLAEEVSRRTRIEQDLRVSETRFRMMFQGAATGITVISPSGRFISANPAYCASTGYSEAELRTMSIDELLLPEDRPTYEKLIGELIDGARGNFVLEIRCMGKLGTIIWKRASVSLMRDAQGAPVNIIVVAEDVTARHLVERELVRVNRAQRMLSACNESLVRTDSEPALLKRICKVAVEIGGYRMAWVGFAEHDEGKTIRPVAHAGEENGYLSEIAVTWDESQPSGRGPGGLTIRGGVAVVCADIEADERFALWRSVALAHGYRGVLCLPLRFEQNTYGLLGLHAGEPLDIGSDEIRLLQQLADDLAFGLAAIRAREERQKTLDAVLRVAQGVSASVGDAFFERLTQSMVAALGADVGVVARLNPADPGEAGTLALVVDGRLRENVIYRIEGGPCAHIAPEQPSVVMQNVQSAFPACGLLKAFDAQAYIGHPLLDSDGHMIGLMAVVFRGPVARAEFILSTLRIFASRASAELHRQEADSRLREQAALLDKAQDAIIVRDLEHHIGYWNKSAERLYGWTAAEAVGRSIAQLLYRDPTDFHEATRQTVEKGEWVGELRQVTKAGVDLTVECHWTLVRDADGRPRSVLAINTDITERKRLEHQFLRAQRMESIGTLAGGIAHDLNNVLAPILMSADLLRIEETSPRRLSLIDSIANSAQRGADMVGQVLAFARGVDGQRVKVDIAEVVHDVERICRDTFPKSIVIESTVSDGVGVLTGDPTQIHQVLVNLCVNARDAMPEGGRLIVRAEDQSVDAALASMYPGAKSGPHVCLEVEDTGLGIAPGNLEKVFDPFYTTKEIGKGTGLGLSTSQAIVKGHGGFIRVYSEVGRGTRFMVYLPLGERALERAQAAPMLDLPRGAGETVLVVDDEPPIREVARKILEAFGYKTILAGDGAEAMALHREHRGEIALVLTDMMMPVMDGAATIQELRKSAPHIRIIAASGITDDGKIPRAAAVGVRHFLAKPFNAATLLRAVRAALDEQPGPTG